MDLLKPILGVVMLLVVAVGGAYAAAQRGIIPMERIQQLKNAVSVINRPELKTVTQTTRSGVTILSSKTEESASKAGVVLGSHIQAADDQPPLHQRAFEYARYSYCQEVINDYSARYPSNEPPPSPTP